MTTAPGRTARERLREERVREQRRQRRMRRVSIVVGAVAVVLVVVVVGIVVQSQRDKSSGFAGRLAPVSVQRDGTVVMAQPGVTSPVLDVYEDFQCPICREFERIDGATVKQLAAAGKVRVVYHPFTVFSEEPARSNSERAAASARCAPADTWMAYHDELYAHQPDETQPGGFPLDELVKYGRQAGITDPRFAQCVRTRRYLAEVEQFSRSVLASGVDGTPTVRLNGVELDLQALLTSPDALKTAVVQAAGHRTG